MFGLVAAVLLYVPPYGTSALVEGGTIEMNVYRPGWEVGAPKSAYSVATAWRQDGKAVECTYRVCFKEDIDLQSIGLQWRISAALTAGRDWSADDQTRQVPEKFSRLTLGDGVATSFTFPLPNGRTLNWTFPEPVCYLAQDNRKWGEDWLLRFGPALVRRVHPKGEELVYRVRFTSPEGVTLEKQNAHVIRSGDAWVRLENRKEVRKGSALDFSNQGLQDAPAGKYGWLKAVRGTFEFAARPGVAQRFYGVNLCFSANYLAQDEADDLVEYLVRSGYNTIRIHHHDDYWAKHPEARGKLDYLIARAISRGLYITTDLYVSRKATWRELGEDRPGGPDVQLYKTLVAVDEKAYSNWLAFAKEFLCHVNPHTGRAYRDEPGMPLLSLVNEGNLGMGFGHAKQTNPSILAAWRAFSGNPTAEKVPSPWTNAQARDFDTMLERRFVEKATVALRALGVKALLTNDNNGSRHGEGEGATSLYDYVDNHFYIDHPRFLDERWQLPSSCPNENPVRLGQPEMFAKGYAKNSVKPYAITEWNFSGPGRYRALGGILTGALAARDEWDALWRFAYSHDRRNLADDPDQTPGYFDCSTDPLSRASDRASVFLFLRGDANDGTVTTDATTGAMSFVSPMTCGGFVESGRLVAGALAAEITGAPAAVWVSSLDGRSVSASRRLLLVHLTDVQSEGRVYAESARKTLLDWGRGCLIERGTARISLVQSADLSVWALDATGRRIRRLPVTRAGGHLTFTCSTTQGTIYYELCANR